MDFNYIHHHTHSILFTSFRLIFIIITLQILKLNSNFILLLKFNIMNYGEEKQIFTSTIENRGTGACGSNTNKNGLSYEKITDLEDKIAIVEDCKTSKKLSFTITTGFL